MKITGIIPSRYNSTRFPGKPLVDIMGKSMIQRVYDQACKVNKLDDVIIATDDKRIFDHATDQGMTVQMTADNHLSGTDRCAEVARDLKTDIIVNIQGDEPFLEPSEIENLLKCFDNPLCEIATLITPIRIQSDLTDPNRVKCVTTNDGKALYFSRLPIPYRKEQSYSNSYKHIGLYAYRRQTLLKISALKPSPLELAENLEQLRWLENGFSIYTTISNIETPNIDTPEDLRKIVNPE